MTVNKQAIQVQQGITTHLDVSRHFIKILLVAFRQDDTCDTSSVSSENLFLDPSNLLHKSSPI